MTSHPDPPPIQLQVNLAVVQGHYQDAVRLHFRSRARASQYTAIRDIPLLISEIERLWTLLTESLVGYANLRAAVLATMTAYEAHQADPFSHLRAQLLADDRRRRDRGLRA
jgi:hypothetical protein